MWRIFGGTRREVEQNEGLEAHIDIEAASLESEGLSPADATREARRNFGNAALVAEQTRDT